MGRVRSGAGSVALRIKITRASSPCNFRQIPLWQNAFIKSTDGFAERQTRSIADRLINPYIIVLKDVHFAIQKN